MTKIIAVCGVDGCGKSSLIKAYAAARAAEPIQTFHKTQNRCVQLTQGYHQRSGTPNDDWLAGSFALSIGAGAMFDFLDHYQRAIEPALTSSNHLLCDRYTFCFLAYLAGTGHDRMFDQLFAHVRPADHVIHVDVAFDLLEERYAQREEKNEDEFIELMVAFRRGYDIVYERLGIQPTVITNNAEFDAALSAFTQAVDSAFGIEPGVKS